MTTPSEKSAGTTLAGLTIPPPARAFQSSSQPIGLLTTIEDLESTHSLSPATTLSPDEKTRHGISPLSPFYDHAPTRLSLEAQKSESRRNINQIPTHYDNDLEAGLSPPTSAGTLDKPVPKSKTGNFHCSVWPDRQDLKMKKKAMRRDKGRYMLCGWMARLSKTQRIWVKIIFAAVVIGAAVGIAIGITKAVGGGVWKNSQNTNAPI
jgi:hypothetical protein